MVIPKFQPRRVTHRVSGFVQKILGDGDGEQSGLYIYV